MFKLCFEWGITLLSANDVKWGESIHLKMADQPAVIFQLDSD